MLTDSFSAGLLATAIEMTATAATMDMQNELRR